MSINNYKLIFLIYLNPDTTIAIQMDSLVSLQPLLQNAI